MRLWHIDLIDVLPRQQLLGQWRELNSIFKKQDKHILINYIYDYPERYLLTYTNKVLQEFYKSGFKINSVENYNKFFELTENIGNERFIEHNKEYLVYVIGTCVKNTCAVELRKKNGRKLMRNIKG